MKVALDNFATMPVSPKALILGDMRELGPTSDELHAEVIARIKEDKYDKVFLCGEHFQKAAGKDFATYASTEELIEALRKNPLKGLHVLWDGAGESGRGFITSSFSFLQKNTPKKLAQIFYIVLFLRGISSS